VEKARILRNKLDLHMEGAKRHVGTLKMASTYATVIARAVSSNRPKLGPNGASGGATAPWLGRLGTTFAWWSAGWNWIKPM
jgi:hypothetical protein